MIVLFATSYATPEDGWRDLSWMTDEYGNFQHWHIESRLDGDNPGIDRTEKKAYSSSPLFARNFPMLTLKWIAEDDQRLWSLYREGLTTAELAAIFQRKPGADRVAAEEARNAGDGESTVTRGMK